MEVLVSGIVHIKESSVKNLHLTASSPSKVSSSGSSTVVSETAQGIPAKLIDQATGETVGQYSRLREQIAQGPRLELELLLLTFCTGVIDTATFSAHGVFCSKQTGNTIFIALAFLNPDPTSHQNKIGIITSLLSFTAGAITFGWTGNIVGHQRRLWLLISNFISATLVLSAAGLQWYVLRPRAGTPEADHMSVPIVALCALACAGQFSLSINTRGPELNTSVVTSAVVTLAADRRLFGRNNPDRNRRFLFVLSMAAGAASGAALTRFVGPSCALLLDAICKCAIGFLFLTNPRYEE